MSAALDAFLDEQIVGALVTRSATGSVHQSLVYYARQDDALLISTLAGRRKARDVEETGWASLCVMGHERPFPSVTVSGAAEIRRDEIGAPTAEIGRRMLGLVEPPEEQSDAALADVGRVILVLRIERVGPASYLEL
jgi:Pyridoxamine 5'-phosphate oxidase